MKRYVVSDPPNIDKKLRVLLSLAQRYWLEE